jgi:hypothetical protein
MYNNDVGKGVVYAYEAYEAKQRVAAFRAPVCFINFWVDSLMTSLLYISTLLRSPAPTTGQEPAAVGRTQPCTETKYNEFHGSVRRYCAWS